MNIETIQNKLDKAKHELSEILGTENYLDNCQPSRWKTHLMREIERERPKWEKSVERYKRMLAERVAVADEETDSRTALPKSRDLPWQVWHNATEV